LSETALWLNYCLGGLIALVASYFRVRIAFSIVPAAAVPIAIWLLVPVFNGAGFNFNDPWFGPGLFINACFALIFATVGALLGRGFRNS
jgi:hypothetical protein